MQRETMAGLDQHGLRAIHLVIKEVLKGLCRRFYAVTELPDGTVVSHEIAKEGNFFPGFKDCIGVVDGSHVPIKLKGHDAGAHRNRKGGLSQNVLAVCDFDLNILWLQSGYEGSAHDGTVLRKARQNGFKTPAGRYYLGDGGYSSMDKGLLIPYQRTRYHLREHRASQQKPETPRELFNLRHSQLRNAVGV